MYKSKRQKLRKSWKISEDNTNKLNNIPLISLNFNSINFNKKITTIPILTDKIEPIFPFYKFQSILLENFPENILNMIEPSVIYTIEDGFVSQFGNGNTYVTVQLMNYWFNRIDQKNFLLKIFYNINIRYTGNIIVPITTNMSLKIYNQRNY